MLTDQCWRGGVYLTYSRVDYAFTNKDISKDREGYGSEGNYLVYPFDTKTKGFKDLLYVFLANFVKGFREIEFKEHTYLLHDLKVVDHFVAKEDAIHDFPSFNIS